MGRRICVGNGDMDRVSDMSRSRGGRYGCGGEYGFF